MLLFCNIFCQTNYLSIYWTALHLICRVGRTLALPKMNDMKLFFRSLKGQSHGNQFLLTVYTVSTQLFVTLYLRNGMRYAYSCHGSRVDVICRMAPFLIYI